MEWNCNKGTVKCPVAENEMPVLGFLSDYWVSPESILQMWSSTLSSHLTSEMLFLWTLLWVSNSIVASVGSDSAAVGRVAGNGFSYPLTVTNFLFDMVISQTEYDTTSWLLVLMQRDTCGIIQDTTLIYNWFTLLPLTLRCMLHIWPRAEWYGQKYCYSSPYHLL